MLYIYKISLIVYILIMEMGLFFVGRGTVLLSSYYYEKDVCVNIHLDV